MSAVNLFDSVPVQRIHCCLILDVDAGNDLRQNFEIHLAFGDDLKEVKCPVNLPATDESGRSRTATIGDSGCNS